MSEAKPPNPNSMTSKGLAKSTTSVSLLPPDKDNLAWLMDNDPSVEGVTDALRVGMQARIRELKGRQKDRTLAETLSSIVDERIALLSGIDQLLLRRHLKSDTLSTEPTINQQIEFNLFALLGLAHLQQVYRYCGVPRLSLTPVDGEADDLFDYYTELAAFNRGERSLPTVAHLYSGEWLALVCNLQLINKDADFIDFRDELISCRAYLSFVLGKIQNKNQDNVFAHYFLRPLTMIRHVLGDIPSPDLPSHDHFCCNSTLFDVINGNKPAFQHRSE